MHDAPPRDPRHSNGTFAQRSQISVPDMNKVAAQTVIATCSLLESTVTRTPLRRGPRWLNNHLVPTVARRAYREGPTRVNGVMMTIPRPPDWGGGGEFHMALGTYERPEIRFLRGRLHPGDTFVDVGAHIGYVALPAARAVGPTGRVIAVEAFAESAARLREHKALNGLDWLEVHECAAAGRDGMVALNVSGTSAMWSSIADRHDTGETRTVPAVRLDTLLEGISVTGVKIDVEGAEADVLGGLTETIEANPEMFLIVECEGGRRAENSAATLEVLRRYGFTLAGFRPLGSPRILRASDIDTRLKAGRPFNLLCTR